VRVRARLLTGQEAHRLGDKALVGERLAGLIAREALGLGRLDRRVNDQQAT
jgi:hypothetical protein